MVRKQGIKKVKLSSIFLIISFVVIGFIALVKKANKDANKYISLNYQMEVDSTNITGNEGYGVLRGAVFFKKGYCIGTSAKFIEDTCNYNKWESNGPIVDFNSEPHEYTLDDLGFPYIVYKKADNDTIFVIKKACVLKFLMQ